MTLAVPASAAGRREERRAAGVACGAHALHDGFTDLVYVLLPVWQAEFGLGYAAPGMLRTLFSGTLAALQIPSGVLAQRLGSAPVLALGTALVGVGYRMAGASSGLALLALALALGGAGASTQHPIGSSVIAQAFAGPRSLKALGAYNFAGDIGKMAVPAAASLLLVVLPWRETLSLLGGAALLAALAIFALAPRPKGASLPAIGAALTAVFAGGAVGKLVCAFLGARIGAVATVWLTEAATALGIVGLLPLSLEGALLLLPLLGVALNGTSSVLYGSVPDLVAPAQRVRAFSIFYTGTVGAGAAAPILYGVVGDAAGVPTALVVVALMVLLNLPLSGLVSRRLSARRAAGEA